MKFYTLITSLFIINSCILNAQNNKPTKEDSLEIDAIYQSFSAAYATFNAEKMSNCYLDNAVSIAHYEGRKPFILNGKKAILNDCTDFFNAIKSNKQTLTIEFIDYYIKKHHHFTLGCLKNAFKILSLYFNSSKASVTFVFSTLIFFEKTFFNETFLA